MKVTISPEQLRQLGDIHRDPLASVCFAQVHLSEYGTAGGIRSLTASTGVRCQWGATRSVVLPSRVVGPQHL